MEARVKVRVEVEVRVEVVEVRVRELLWKVEISRAWSSKEYKLLDE